MHPDRITTTAYDAAGNRTSLRKRDGSLLQYQYDNLNRMILKIVPERPSGAQALTAAQTRDVYYGYDLRNAQLYARFDSASGEGVTNVYDGFGRLTSSSTNMGGTTRTLTYGYDARGNRTSITHPDGTYFAAWYDGLDRQYYLHVNGVAGLMYDYKAADGTSAVFARVGIGTYYGYDGMQRLAGMAHATGAPTDVSYAYTRNPAGQLASLTRTGDAYAWTGHYAVQRPYTTNGLNQYTDAGGAAFTYDANGNLATSPGAAEVQTFVYDVENRLVGRSGSGTSPTVALAYDPLGRLYRVSSPTTDTRFLYDGDALVAEYDAAGAMTQRYAHWTGADVPVVAFQDSGIGTMRQLLPDHQGSIVAQADGNAAIVQVNTYDEYGIPGAGNQGRFQYTGQIWLPELGMYHYKARVYSPTLGRFLQTDPIGYADQFNLYAYVGNDPMNLNDPTGEESSCNPQKSSCVTLVYGPGPSGGNAVSAPNVTPENRRTQVVLGNRGLDQAASEVAGIVDQKTGNERVYRQDQVSILGVEIVISTQVSGEASQNGMVFDPDELRGADGALHTEPTASNSGVPGVGDWRIPDEIGIPNYAAFGRNVTAMEQQPGGAASLRPVNHSNTHDFAERARHHQDRRTVDPWPY